MFQPQAIPFSSLAYAASVSDNSLPSDYNFQAATLNLGLNFTNLGSVSDNSLPSDYNFQAATLNLGLNFTDLGSFESRTQRYTSTMDTPLATDNMAAQEAPARGYQPDLKGPLMAGEKSSHDIREEHAKVDPGYVSKASQLCQTYSHYQPLLDDANCRWRDGVGNFCKDMVEPLNTEIGIVGVTILIDVLMNPMSIAVEIVYLDRSGTHVNSHLIRAEDDNGIPINPAGPIVHLLYQPGHYDILYKYTNTSRSLRQQQIIDSASAASNIQINRGGVFNRALDPSPMSNLNSFNLPGTVNIPGLSMAALSNHGFPSTYTPLSDYKPILTPTYPFDTSVLTPNMQYVLPISAVSPHDSGTPIVPAAAPSIHSAPSRPQRTRNLQVEVPPSSLGNQFRHSKYEYESDWNDPSAQIFQTSMFKNSHYNTAHYSNPNFQPEEWSPDDETSYAPRRFDESQVDVHVTLK
ncbi:hypothetical protein V502_00569 [Pseudogymnoascus sp. VKM F-4520 (FW-2644)]|nr:hypothetical protein V502_00569 [Pseudogymnoascus sp. VKM F-4520 (FW-2644)]